jgi:hypothetical protein
MRITHARDWILWSFIAAIIVVAATEYYTERQQRMSAPAYVYKIIATPDHSTH